MTQAKVHDFTSEQNKRMENSRSRQALRTGVILFCLALALRLIYLLDASDAPNFQIPIVDSLVYHQAAKALAEGEGLSETFFFQPFLYPFLLAGNYKVTGTSILAAKIIQAMIGAATCLLTYLMGRKIFGQGAGLAAGLVTALYGPLIFFETELLATGLAAFWAVALAMLFLKASEEKTGLFFALLGLCGAAAVLTRPVFLPWFALGTLWLLIQIYRAPQRRTFPVRPALLILVGFALPLVPVAVASWKTFDHFSFLPASGGVNVYIGNNENYDETINARLGSEWSDVIDLPKRHGVRGSMWERQQFYYKQVMHYITSQPFSFSAGLLHKGSQFVSSRETPRNVDLYLFRKWSVVLRSLAWKLGPFGFPFGLLFPLAAMGLVFSRKRAPPLLLLGMLLYSLSVIVVFVTARYRLPIIPLVAILAGAGIVELVQTLRERCFRRLAAILAVAAAVILVGTLPGPFVAEKMDYKPELLCSLADSLLRTGQLDPAIGRFQEAIELNESYVDAHVNLATPYIEQGESEKAIKACRKALELQPDLAQALCNLAILLTRPGSYEEALQLCRRGIEVRPHEEAFYFNMARIYSEQGQHQEMVKHLEKVLELEPKHAAALHELARFFERLGRTDDAIRVYDKVRGELSDPAPLNHLGTLLLRSRQYSEAAEVLTRALAAEPEKLTARHSLAVVLANSGQEEEAVREYSRVLDLQPDYVPSLAGLAWLRATHPDPALRSGSEAIALAERARDVDPSSPNMLNTLAAAYAEAGQFEDAVATAKDAIAFAEQFGMRALAREIRARLRLYQEGKPFRKASQR